MRQNSQLMQILNNIQNDDSMMVGEKLQEQKVEKIRSILVQQPPSKQNNALCFIEGDCMPHEIAGSRLLALVQNFLKKSN
jgi:hypothetical protein